VGWTLTEGGVWGVFRTGTLSEREEWARRRVVGVVEGKRSLREGRGTQGRRGSVGEERRGSQNLLSIAWGYMQKWKRKKCDFMCGSESIRNVTVFANSQVSLNASWIFILVFLVPCLDNLYLLVIDND